MVTKGKCSGFSRTTMTVILAVVLVAVTGVVPASADPTPRILLAGDSWTGFMLAFRSFREVLQEYEGLDRWIEVGNRTAEMGARVFEMLDRNFQQTLTEELTRYPNIDVVVITLGGNDILRGSTGVDPNNFNRKVKLDHCYESSSGQPWSEPSECVEWLAQSVKENVSILVDHILSVRPDVRVAILSYDYGARLPRNPAYSLEEMHLAFVAVQERIREIALSRDRVEFIMNFGLMQNIYGIPSDGYPEPGFPEEDIPAGVPPYPCNDPAEPDCAFWPGGFPQYLSPMSSYIDQDIHLTAEGYAHIARRAMDLHIEEWLNFPKAMEILPLDNKATYQFQVTFSHPVTGVDLSDFEVYINAKSGMKSMDVINVQAISDDVYLVTVDMSGSEDVAFIKVLDDDSIVRIDTGAPLGGPGIGNGLFVFNGDYEFFDLPEAEDDDFEGALGFLYMASMAYEHLLGELGLSFNPDYFDANGNFLQDGSLDKPISIPGNGILDLWEFMVIDAVLKRPDLDLSATGGLTYQDVRTAWDLNIDSVQAALGGKGGLADIILPGLDTVLAAFYTLGDKDSSTLVGILVGQLGDVDEFPTNMDPEALTPYDASNTVQFLSRFLGLGGDADGDGWRNVQEYQYFFRDGLEAYVNAVLDPNIQPNNGKGKYNIGDFVRIALMDRPYFKSTFQWYHNGVPIESNKDGRIIGADTFALDITSLQPEDSGSYTCTYLSPIKTGGTYPEKTYGPIVISVRDTSGMPAGGVVTLSLLVLGLGMGGVRVFRKK